MKPFLLGSCLLLGTLPSLASAQVFQNFAFLNAELSVRMALTAVEHCDEQGYAVSAAVMNREGRLMAFARHPLASPMTAEISQGKAYTSALTQAETGALDPNGAMSYAQGTVLTEGGLPFSAGGRFIGGIGISGAPSAVDVICARAGIEAVQADLEFAE